MLTFLLLLALKAMACPVSPAEMKSMLGRPNFKSMVVSENGLTERDFKVLVERVRKVYDPVFASQGYAVEYLLYWDVEEGNAMTSESKDEKKAWFMFSGGLLRAKYMTKDGFLFAACHEIGHHLGGFPKEKELKWCSTEGQADYFANLRCMKELLKGDPENAKARELKLPANIVRRCEKTYSDEESINICLRSTKAAEDAYKFLQAKESGKDADESLFNRFMMPANETIMRYPEITCRAETAYRGAICDRQGELSDTDETAGVCHKKNGDRIGMRPACWFKPQVDG
ncbi:MAG: hypothetical protein V4598_00155 [Bdellovibrionota bacterium]